MSALALYLEAEGLTTVCIALIREHAERMKPPRALWVPFPLGRPFGAAGDAEQQTRVVRTALELLNRDVGPVLEDYPDDMVMDDDTDTGPWVCPVSFPRKDESIASPTKALLQEIRALKPWYSDAVKKRGRTTVGISGVDIETAATTLASQVEKANDDTSTDFSSLVNTLRWCADDLKAFYFEAASAQGGVLSQTDLEHWFWGETQAANLLRDLRKDCLGHQKQSIRDVGAFMLVPDQFI